MRFLSSTYQRLFVRATIFTVVLSAVTFYVIFNNEPVRLELQSFSLIDPDRPLIVSGTTEVTTQDMSYMTGFVATYFTIGTIAAYAVERGRKSRRSAV